MAHVSLKDVAARSGLSFQNASTIRNGIGTVSAETRLRILAAADELGDVPNTLARGLLSRRTGTIGGIASDFSDTVLFQIEVQREARRHGRGVIIACVHREGSDGVRSLRTLIERRVGGIVTIAPKPEGTRRSARCCAVPSPRSRPVAKLTMTTRRCRQEANLIRWA